MKNFVLILAILVLAGCTAGVSPKVVETAVQACPGDTALPDELKGSFAPVAAPALLAKALGRPEEGKLCQAQVYESRPGTRVILYRAWNSTNPGSQLGSWWAFHSPEGKVADYRAGYEICYQWSPLDKLVRCRLKPGIRVVVGTGQSARCSNYLSYPASPRKQIYLDNAAGSVIDCTAYDAVFDWQAE